MVFPHSVSLLRLARFAAGFEGVADAAFDAHPGVDRFLDRDLVRRALAQNAARAGIQPFRVFPDDQEIDVGGGFILQGRIHVRVEFHRPQVDVLIQFEPQAQQQSFFENARLHIRMPDRAQVDRVQFAEFRDHAVGQNLPGALVAFAAQVVIDPVDPEPEFLRGRLEDLSCPRG